MKVLFDTSVLIPAVVDQLPNHEAALDCYVRYTGKAHKGHCSTHTLAELYATLTALPLPRRILPYEARRLIEENFLKRLTVVELDKEAYRWAIGEMSDRGHASGRIYDALHLVAAIKAGCKRVYTYNPAHFQDIADRKISITAP